jgi:hypothetical protein
MVFVLYAYLNGFGLQSYKLNKKLMETIWNKEIVQDVWLAFVTSKCGAALIKSSPLLLNSSLDD